MVYIPEEAGTVSGWPGVKPDDWCGEHKFVKVGLRFHKHAVGAGYKWFWKKAEVPGGQLFMDEECRSPHGDVIVTDSIGNFPPMFYPQEREA